MKRETWVILGYGIPHNMAEDMNYQVYLRTVFNRAYEYARQHGVPPRIVCSGGPTDMAKPYRRTEAGEMIRELRRFVATLPTAMRRGWTFIAENTSLSTLENLLFVRKIVGRIPLTFFCEVTRIGRIRKTVPLVFGRAPRTRIVGVDFDVSANRYLDPSIIRQKEDRALRFDRWTMQRPAHLKRHHQVYRERVAYLRSFGPKRHVEAVRSWIEHAERMFPDIVALIS